MTIENYDALLVGSGTMSTTLAMLLKQLDPTLKIAMIEQLDDVAQESSAGWNNAGTGHAAYCELNYTPEDSQGDIDISKAISINAAFELSLQFWSHLVQSGELPSPKQYINSTPHYSFVWGEQNVDFLSKRYQKLSAHHLFKGMEYSEDPRVIEQWMPLVMDGRDPSDPVAATKMKSGTDVDFGSLSNAMVRHLENQENFNLKLQTRVDALSQQENNQWNIDIQNTATGEKSTLSSRFIFIGAGGGTLPLLQKSGIEEARGYAGFPVSGQWLVCSDPDTINAHSAKVYGKAAIGAPPMSVPHLDTRVINGKKALLFGPFAGFTTKFLKQGSLYDMPVSIRKNNLFPLMDVGINNLDLTHYLIKESLQSNQSRMKALREYLPLAKDKDWSLTSAGVRVQVINKESNGKGVLKFGTETVVSKDGSLAALMGASPGASIAVQAMLEVIEQCFAEKLKHSDWSNKLQNMIPSYGVALADDAAHIETIRPITQQTLGLCRSTKGADNQTASAKLIDIVPLNDLTGKQAFSSFSTDHQESDTRQSHTVFSTRHHLKTSRTATDGAEA